MVYLPTDLLPDDSGLAPVAIVAPAYPPPSVENLEGEIEGVGLLDEQPRIAVPIEPLPEISAVADMPTPTPAAAPPAIGASKVKTTTETVTKPGRQWLPLWATILIPVIGLPLAWWLWRRRRKKKA